MAGIPTIGNVPTFSLSSWKGSTLPTAYNNSMDIYEALVQMTNYLNDMGLLVNTVADQWNQITTWISEDGLNQMVIAQLNKWVQDGTFTKILEDTALKDIDTRLNEEVSKRASEDVRIQEQLQGNIDNVRKDMKYLIGTIENELKAQISQTNAKHDADTTNLTNKINANDAKQTNNANSLKAQFQNEIDNMANGAPVAAYDTLAELQANFPNGASGAYLVNEDGYVYFWRNGSWSKAVKYANETQTASNLGGSNAIVYTQTPINVNEDDLTIEFPPGEIAIGGKTYPFIAQTIPWQNINYLFFNRDSATFNLGQHQSDSTFVGATSLDDRGRHFLQINASNVTYSGSDGDRIARVSDSRRFGSASIITDAGQPIWINMDGTSMTIPKGHIYSGREEYSFDETTVNISAGYLCYNHKTGEFSIGKVDYNGDWVLLGWFKPTSLHAGGTLMPHLYGNPDWYISESKDQLQSGQIFKTTNSTELMSSTRGMFYPTVENGMIVLDTLKKTLTFPEMNVSLLGHEYHTPEQVMNWESDCWIDFNRQSLQFTPGGQTEYNWYITTVGYIKTVGKSLVYLPIPDDCVSVINSGASGGNQSENLTGAFLTDSFGVHIGVANDYIDDIKLFMKRSGYNMNVNRNSIGGTQITKTTGRTDSFAERISSFADTNADFLVIQGGTNDWGAANQMGTIDDTNPETFMGSLNYIINIANTQFPQVMLYFATPIDRNDNDSTAPGKENNLGLTLDDYIEAMHKVCDKWNVPYIDLKKETGIYPWANGTTLLYDRLHPTELGHQRIAHAIFSHLGY